MTTPLLESTPAKQSSNNKNWRPDIQGLRAIAVLGVVLFHAEVPGFSGGFVGVDVFFVISGLLVTGMLYRANRSTGIFSFLASRVQRLVPASICVLLVVTVLVWLTSSPLVKGELLKSIAASALEYVNITFANNSTDYLAGDDDSNPVLNFWTLSLEWQYYLLWAVVSLLAIWILKKRGYATWKVGLALAVTGLIVSFVISVQMVSSSPGTAFFLLQSRLWEFLVGAVLFFLIGRVTLGTPRLRFWYGWVGVVAICLSITLYSASTQFPGVAALLPVLGTALVILAGAPEPQQDRNDARESFVSPRTLSATSILSISVANRIGLTSYSWYLWHWPGLVLVAAWWGESLDGDSVDLPWRWGIVVLVATYILAELSYRFVEEPFRRSWLKTTPSSLGFGIVSTAVVVALALGLTQIASPAQSDTQIVHKASAAMKDFPLPVQDGCQRALPAAESKPCVYGDVSAEKSIAIWGDSHAAMWFSPLNKMSKEHHLKLLLWSKGSCPPGFPTEDPTLFTAAQHCKSWGADVMQQILEMKPKAVVLAGMWQGYVPKDGSNEAAMATMKSSVEKTIDQLNDAGIPVVLVQDVPQSPYPSVPQCVAQKGVAECDFTADPSFDGNFERSIVEGRNAVVVNYNDDLCPGGQCEVVVGGNFLYRDDDHITGSYSKTLDPNVFWNQIREVLD